MTSIKRKFLPILFAGIVIPLGPGHQWKNYQFNRITPNQVDFVSGEVRIKVNNSASPLIYIFPKETQIHSLKVLAQIPSSLPSLPENTEQGYRDSDDFILRIGLIVKGENRLSWLQRQLAPQWLIDMEKELPQNAGIEKVYFITTCRQKSLLHKIRKHHLNTTLIEECVKHLETNGEFLLIKDFSKSLPVLGLWISSDGDDLHSRYELRLKKVQINHSKKPS